MNMKSISFTLNLSLLVISTVVLSGFGYYGYQLTEKRLNEQLAINADLTKDRLTLSLPVPIWNFELESVAIIINSETKSEHIQGVLVRGNDEAVLAGAVKNAKGEITPQQEAPTHFAKMIKQPLEMVENGEKNAVGYAEIYVSDNYVLNFLDQEKNKIIIQIVALNLVILLLFSISIRRITRPLVSLTRAADSISQGDYEMSIQIEREDEVGRLASNFDRMRTTVKKKVKDLAELNKSGEVLASLMDRNAALEEVLKNMHHHTKVQMGSVYLYNQHRQLELTSCFPPKIIEPPRKAKSFNPKEGVIGKAAHEKHIIFVPDTSKSDEFVLDGQLNDTEPSTPLALLCVPLIDNGIVIGVMNFSGQVDEVAFDDSDYEYAESLARSLVTTVKNIRMREVIEEQNRTLEQKVIERTAALQVKTNDISNMLQNMHQGLCTIQSDNTIHPEYSAYLEDIYETKGLAGRNFLDLLFEHTDAGSDTRAQVRAAIEVLHEADEFMWDCNEHHLIKEVTGQFDGDRKKHLQLDWDPIFSEGVIEKIMVTVRDVTKLKALEKEAESQKQELTIIGEILNIDRRKFDEFINSSKQFIADNHDLILTTPNKDVETIGTLFRNMHTIKGNARTFGFSLITHLVHDAESAYDRLRKFEDSWQPQELLKQLNLVAQVVGRYEMIAKEKLSMSNSSVCADDKAIIDRSVATKLVDMIDQVRKLAIPEDLKADFIATQKAMLLLEAETVSDAISGVIRSMPSLANELGKPKPVMEIDTGNILIKRSASPTLTNVFMHALRNALDHGIELPQERTQKGKTPEGHLFVRSEQKKDRIILSIHDDGRGLALQKVKQKAILDGLISSTDKLSLQETAQLILRSGFSTADSISEVSGRGVGMDAIKRFMEERGGKIDVVLRTEQMTQNSEFCPFVLQITLPKEMYVLLN